MTDNAIHSYKAKSLTFRLPPKFGREYNNHWWILDNCMFKCYYVFFFFYCTTCRPKPTAKCILPTRVVCVSKAWYTSTHTVYNLLLCEESSIVVHKLWKTHQWLLMFLHYPLIQSYIHNPASTNTHWSNKCGSFHCWKQPPTNALCPPVG